MFSSSLFTLPLACTSFALFHAVKYMVHRLARRRDRHQDALDWQTMSEALRQRLALPYIMVTGPRWNPHALISRVGPFQLENSLRIKVGTAHQSAQTWTLIINRAVDLYPIAVVDASDIAREEVWYEHALPPGRYLAVLRYYEWTATPHLPEMTIDNRRRVPERAVPPNENDYLSGLREKDGFFYACLHYYVLEMLRLRRYLPASFVRREYLPVGNPETVFDYGALRRSQSLEISSSQGIPEGYRLYLTIYNRSSFPVSWSEVRALPHRTLPVATKGSYLWRLHAVNARDKPPVWPEHLQVDLR
jgi:Family of unknown function (DUF6208)